MNDTLADLKGIHLPEPVSWWPLAPGWWMLIVLIVAVITVSLYMGLRHYQRNAFRRQALQELQQLRHQALPAEQLLSAISQLIRRTVISSRQQRLEASLQGQDWQQFLQQYMPETQAHLLAVGQYQAHPAVDTDKLLHSTEQWLKRYKP